MSRSAFLLVFLLACGGRQEAPKIEAPSGPLAGGTPRAVLDRVKVSTDLSALRSAVSLYKGTHDDELPPDLGTLGVTGLNYPDHYVYDAGTGEVRCDDLPDL